MAKIRTRPNNGLLFMDFYYRGIRCREQTALPDTAENRRRVQSLLKRISKEIAQGSFDYAATFPNSPRAAQFAVSASKTSTTQPVAIPAPSNPSITSPTFAEFSITWRSKMAPQWRRQHRIGMDDIFEQHLLPVFGEKMLSVIGKPDVLAFRAELAKRPGRTHAQLSPSRINKIMGMLRQCLNEASERFGLPDAFKGVKRLKCKRPEIQPFSLEEVERIRNTIRADYTHYVTVRFFTGLRSGEVNGLKWKFVDFEQNLILVRETFSDGEAEESAKTEASIRDIPMLPQVRDALKAQFEQRHPTSDYVFCSREGNPIDAHNFANRVWYPLLRYLDIAKRRPYQTRHTTATLMLASGENPEWIARLMGHTTTEMLFTVYSRFVPNLTRQDGLAIAGLLSSRIAPSVTSETPTTAPDPRLLDQLKSLPAAQLDALLRQARNLP